MKPVPRCRAAGVAAVTARTIAGALVLAAAFAATPAAGGATCPADDELRRALERVNARREPGGACGRRAHPGAAPLAWHDGVAAVAQAYATQMAAQRRLAHNDREGRDGGRRLADAGLAWSAWAENLARGRLRADRLVSLWFDSPEHCENLMFARVAYGGLGCAESAAGDVYWTLLLWSPERELKAAPPPAPARTPPAAAPTPD